MSGLGESVRFEWSSDVDLDTGKLQEAYAVYRQLLDFVSKIGLKERSLPVRTCEDLTQCKSFLADDKQFIITCENINC